MSRVESLFVDMALDAVHAYVVRTRGTKKRLVHRAQFDGKIAYPISVCGVKSRGEWRIVSAEYTSHPHCQRCALIVANRTHEATQRENRDG